MLEWLLPAGLRRQGGFVRAWAQAGRQAGRQADRQVESGVRDDLFHSTHQAGRKGREARGEQAGRQIGEVRRRVIVREGAQGQAEEERERCGAECVPCWWPWVALRGRSWALRTARAPLRAGPSR